MGNLVSDGGALALNLWLVNFMTDCLLASVLVVFYVCVLFVCVGLFWLAVQVVISQLKA